jgi:hypothetical protein
MLSWLTFVLRLCPALMRSRRSLLLENVALRHQLLVLTRNAKRPQWRPLDRALWIWLSDAWSGWRTALRLVQPDTVIHWHRQGFRLLWKWKSRPGKVGRKCIALDTIALIRNMSRANPLWGAPRIHGELLKLGITVSQRTVTNIWCDLLVAPFLRIGKPSFTITSDRWSRWIFSQCPPIFFRKSSSTFRPSGESSCKDL